MAWSIVGFFWLRTHYMIFNSTLVIVFLFQWFEQLNNCCSTGEKKRQKHIFHRLECFLTFDTSNINQIKKEIRQCQCPLSTTLFHNGLEKPTLESSLRAFSPHYAMVKSKVSIGNVSEYHLQGGQGFDSCKDPPEESFP